MIVSTATRRPQSIDELVSPELCSRLDRIDILSRKIFAGKLQGERRSKRRGQSVEFEDYRNYVPGDDLRHVDWNVFARLERFFVKVFLEEEDLSFHLVVDASASMQAGIPEKLLLAQRLAMCLGYIALVNNDRVAVSVHDGRELRALPPMRGRRNVQRLAGFLLKEVRSPSPAGGGTDEEIGRSRGISAPEFTSAMRTVALTRKGKGVMVVLSDFLIREGYQDGLRYLAGHAEGAGGRGGGYDVFCLQVLSPGEIDPAVESTGDAAAPIVTGDLKLTDVETGRGAEVTVTSALLKRYRATVSKYMDDLRAFCTARGMTYGLVRSDVDLQTLLLEYLRRRGLLR